jgi:hypothetical protein
VSFFFKYLFFESFPSRQSISTFEAILPTYFNMASPSDILLTNTNYFSWKSLWRMYYEVKDFMDYLGKRKRPTDALKKSKWDNKNDEARGLIRMSISSDLWFHLQGIDDLDEAWKKLEVLFSKHNEIQAH